MDIQRIDCILMEILHDRKTIAGFLDGVFGFLSRNTDFYYEQKTKNDKIGFPPGMKEKIVIKVLQKFDPKYRYLASNGDVPPAIEEVEVVTNAQEKSEVIPEGSNNEKPIISQESSKELFASNEYHNGACFENYCWSQTSTDIELHIRLPANAKSSKNLNVHIEADHIEVCSKLSHGDEPIFVGKLSAKCRHNDALWTISEGKLQITLDKMREAWWDRLVVEEPFIDVSKIDCSKYFDELPPDSQAAIQKLRWEQEQKQAQLPTEIEENNVERLREAWDAEGSPFKGQPFDPSLVKFN